MQIFRQILYLVIYTIPLFLAELLALTACFWQDFSRYAPMALLILGFVVFCNVMAMKRCWFWLQRWCHIALLVVDCLAAVMIFQQCVALSAWSNTWMNLLLAAQAAVLLPRFWMMKKYMV